MTDEQYGQIYIAIQLWLAEKGSTIPEPVRQMLCDHLMGHHLLDITSNEVVEPELLHRHFVEEIHHMLQFAYKSLSDNNLLDNEDNWWKG
jgi:hypothetical protein